MTRHRSKSLVQSIAAELPEFHEHANGSKSSVPVIAEPAKKTLVKSKSEIDLLNSFGSDNAKDHHMLHPLQDHELDRVWNSYISNNFDLGLVPSFESQMKLRKTSQADVLNFQRTIEVNTRQLNLFIEDNNMLMAQLDEIVKRNVHINQQTEDFNTRSLGLINTTNELSERVKAINAVLKNFESLDEITRKLSMPNSSKLIKYSKFDEILENLNVSLDFLKENPNFKENEKFRIKFRQCLTRCLTLIKDFLINNLKTLNANIRTKTTDEDLVSILMYSEFEGYLAETTNTFYHFPKLVGEIRNRIEKSGETEYNGILLEILNNYFAIRLGYLRPYIYKNLNASNSSILIQFAQDNISFSKRALTKEFDLFKKMFTMETTTRLPDLINESLYTFLKDAIEPIYDAVRQKILKETNISALCQVANLLQKYYEFEPDDDSTEVNFGEVFDSISSDVQSRLIFRIQLYVDNKLISYKPQPEDLKIGNKKATHAKELDEDFEDNLFEDLYPPLGKALTILSNIYELVNSVVFDDLAHYIVHSCIEILKTNAYNLCVLHMGKVEAKLYYLKNLVILKYQLNNFDIQYIRTETSLDFTSGLNELYGLFRNGEIMIDLNQNGIFDIIRRTVPKVINNMIDAEHEIELETNNAINELLTEFLNTIILPLNEKEDFQTNFEKFKINLNEYLTNFKNQIVIYMNDLNILDFLLRTLTNILINYYENYYQNLSYELSKQNKLSEISAIMEPEIFTNFVNNIIDTVLNDEALKNNLQDIKPLLKFDEELAHSPSPSDAAEIDSATPENMSQDN